MEEQISRNDLIYESNNNRYDFRSVSTTRSFGDSIFNGKISVSEVNKKQRSFLNAILHFSSNVRPRSKADKEKNDNYDSACTLYEGRELTLNPFKSRIFLLKPMQGKGRPSDFGQNISSCTNASKITSNFCPGTSI